MAAFTSQRARFTVIAAEDNGVCRWLHCHVGGDWYLACHAAVSVSSYRHQHRRTINLTACGVHITIHSWGSFYGHAQQSSAYATSHTVTDSVGQAGGAKSSMVQYQEQSMTALHENSHTRVCYRLQYTLGYTPEHARPGSMAVCKLATSVDALKC